YGEVPSEIEAYRSVLGRYAGDAFVAATLADDVLSNIERGIAGQDDDGLGILVPAIQLRGNESGIGHASQMLGYANTIWSAACSDHTDPGSGWNWTRYMDLVRGGGQPTAPSYAASYVGKSDIPVLAPGEEAVAWIEFKNDGSATWDLNDTRLGTQEPQDRDS